MQGRRSASLHLRLDAERDLRDGRLETALKKLGAARDHDPDDFRTYNGLGEICLHLGRSGQAFRFLEKALALNPFSADALNNLGVLLHRHGKPQQAAACFRKSLSIVPDHPDTLSNVHALRLDLSGPDACGGPS